MRRAVRLPSLLVAARTRATTEERDVYQATALSTLPPSAISATRCRLPLGEIAVSERTIDFGGAPGRTRAEALHRRSEFEPGLSDAALYIRHLRRVDFLAPEFVDEVVGWLIRARRTHPFVSVFYTDSANVIDQFDLVLQSAGEVAYVAAPKSNEPHLIGVDVPDVVGSLYELPRGIDADEFKKRFSCSRTSAATRLAQLAQRGIVVRVVQPGRTRDRFVHPRQILRMIHKDVQEFAAAI